MIKPQPRTIDDIFSFIQEGSLSRRPFQGTINLPECQDLPKFHADDSYKGIRINIPEGKDVIDYTDTISKICSEATYTGRRELLFSAVYEAVRNAHQHGNKYNPEKAIEINYRPFQDGFEVVVSDEGGEIDANFIPFVLLHREGLNSPVNFYRFASGRRQLEGNSGHGTFVIHTAVDEVNYFVNYAGGLSVQMLIKKPVKQD